MEENNQFQTKLMEMVKAIPEATVFFTLENDGSKVSVKAKDLCLVEFIARGGRYSWPQATEEASLRMIMQLKAKLLA